MADYKVGDIVDTAERHRKREEMLKSRSEDLTTVEEFDHEAWNQYKFDNPPKIGDIIDRTKFRKRVPIEKPEPEEAQRSSWIGEFAGNMWAETKRGGGYVVGTLNSPLAFVWGAMNARDNVGKEIYDDMNFLDKSITSLGGAFHSAWRSVSKKDDWGETWDTYYKNTTGQNLKDSLPEGYKWMAPMISTTMAIISDPLVLLPEAAALAKLRAPKDFIKKLPKTLQEVLDNLPKAGKQIYMQHAQWSLMHRGDYMKWWRGLANPTKNAAKTRANYVQNVMDVYGKTAKPSPLAQQGANMAWQMDELGKVSKMDPVHGPKAQSHWGDLADAWNGIINGDMLRRQTVNKRIVQQKAETLAGTHQLEGQGFRLGKGSEPSKIATKGDLMAQGFKLKDTGKALKAGEEVLGQKTVIQELGKRSEWFARRSKELLEKSRGAASEAEMTETLNQSGIQGYKSQLYREAKEVAEGTKPIQGKRIGFKPGAKIIANQSGAVELKAVTSTAGALYGFELDEEGKLRYNWTKGATAMAAGWVGGAALTKVANRPDKLAKDIVNSPAWKKVHESYGNDSGRWAGLFNRKLPAKAWDFIEKKITDRMRPIKDLGSKEAYNMARKFSAYKERAMQHFQVLSDGLKPVRDIEVEFTDYVTAMRDAERASMGIKNPNGVTAAEAATTMADIRKSLADRGFDLNQIDVATENMKKWTHDNILLPSKEAGLISDEMYNATKDKFYLTYEVLDHLPDLNKGVDNMALAPEYFSVANQKVFNKMAGTEKQIADPIQSTIKKFVDTMGTIERNKVARTLIDSLPEDMKFLIPKTQKDYFKMQKQGMNNVRMTVPSDMDVVHMFVNGKVQKWAVDKDLAIAMKTLNQHQAPKFVHAVNNVFRMAATTAYMPFTITNAFRDAMLAYNTAPVYKLRHAPQFASDWIGGLFQGAKHEAGQYFGGRYWDKNVKQYLAEGGGFGWTGEIRKPKTLKSQLFREQALDKKLVAAGAKIIKSPFELTQHISGAIELAPRMAVYNRAIKNGMKHDAATMMARQATIDFNRGGTWMKAANQWIPFLNARVQGRYTALKSLKGKQRANTIAKIAGTVMLPAASTYFMNRTYFSDQYDDIPDYIKNNYFVMITGTKTDPDTNKEVPTYFTIPKGDIGLAWNPVEASLEKMWQDKDQHWGKLALDFISDMSPVQFAREGELDAGVAAASVLPPFVKAPVEAVTNTNLYTGLSIVSPWERANKPDYLITKNSTPEEYNWLAKELKDKVKVDISPLSIQNFASNLLAGYGRQGIQPKAMLDGITGRLYKSKGGAKQTEALEYIHEMKEGYIEAKALAEQLFSDGERADGMRLIRKWNQGLNKRVADFNKRFKKYDIRDRGGLGRKYRISPKKVMNMYKRQRGQRLTPLERRLRRK